MGYRVQWEWNIMDIDTETGDVLENDFGDDLEGFYQDDLHAAIKGEEVEPGVRLGLEVVRWMVDKYNNVISRDTASISRGIIDPETTAGQRVPNRLQAALNKINPEVKK